MSDGRVMISTHDLPLAGALRARFDAEGYETDLVTPTERLTDSDAPTLLIVTGLDDGGSSKLAAQVVADLHLPVFAVTGDAGAIPRLGGFDEVFEPGGDLDDVVLLGRRAIERQRLRAVTGIVGQTDAMHQVLERVVQIAPVTSTVLVTGESGTGKELVARGIHALSPRRHKPFIAVNVAALSETLLESELFGHEKGAFTGAIDSRRGLFELAHGGTIFLDEIGEMPLATQTKLLRVLEQREFHRVGGEASIKVDVRIVAATNQDLRQLVAIGDFRRDLYFRLNVLGIELPALRERRADIPLLVEHFVRDASDRNDRAFPGIAPDAMQLLIDHSWPGNIRELRNLVESMVVLAPGGIIRPEDIPDEVRGVGVSLLPVSIPRGGSVGAEGAVANIRPELEFVFRTLVELRVDMDDLRREFEAYRGGTTARGVPDALLGSVSSGEIAIPAGIEIPAYVPGEQSPIVEEEPEDDVVIYRHGMTIEDMERAAIAAALHEVDGNRRMAAKLLGIGERTLYRKISRYGVDS
ncbi:MAG: sigma-54 dependent transcriptional regulator [Longimicrobiales bacterium]|nr:sigma-54 dependent transcriptional regulator [Longimicrobiales bacterium]